MNYKLDGHKLLHHLDRLIPWSEGKSIFPLYVAFSPTSHCQCACTFCPFHSPQNQTAPSFFPIERFSSLVLELKEAGVKALFFSGTGEPLLHPEIKTMIKLASEAGLALALNSNGLNLKPEHFDLIINHLDWCRFSVNGHDAESYALHQGVDPTLFQEVLNHIEKLAEHKTKNGGKCTLGVQSLFLDQNEAGLLGFVKKLGEFGVDYFSLKPFLKHETSFLKDEFLPSTKLLEKLEALTSDSFKVQVRSSFEKSEPRAYTKCLSFDFMCEIGSEGNVYSCGAKVGNPQFSYGSILKQNFLTLWQGEKRRQQVERIYQNEDIQKCMPHCRHHEVNDWLWRYRHPPAHRNFI